MKLLIRGIVQGVGFRPTVYRVAAELGIGGYVINRGADVEIGLSSGFDEFMDALKKALPPLARISEVKVIDSSRGDYSGFRILSSKDGERSSLLPVDTAICEDCRAELADKKDRRYMFPFINCTNCGARFSAIENLPYDRKKTSMAKFKMCAACETEYSDPLNRRFHAQTTSCPKCGPAYTLYKKGGGAVKSPGGPVSKAAELMDGGKICIIKGWGGMHVACRLDQVSRLRELRKRQEKPFALMARDMKSVRKFAKPTSFEEELLSSPRRPIVLVEKSGSKEYATAMESVSPGLNTVGAMLPYSGLHHALFQALESDVLLMTSANLSGEPMSVTNADAMKFDADYYLLHNRDIINRCDDTVLRTYGKRTFFIRRSRGYTPSAHAVSYESSVLSLGAEENVTITLSKNGKIYPSQYIGNTKYYATKAYLEESVEYAKRIFAVKEFDAVAVDLHPRYVTRGVGAKISKESGCAIYDIQHHWAHAASLMLDCGVDEPIIALTLDGTGYGPDGTAWGGEVLKCTFGSFERVGSLEGIPLIGGDAAVKDPKRVVLGIFDRLGIDPYPNWKDAKILRAAIKNSVSTTSFGRILDALSCYLGICNLRTYDGEPAMKLEKYLSLGKRSHKFTAGLEFRDKRQVVMTTPLFAEIAGLPKDTERRKADIAYSCIYSIAEGMADIAADAARESGIKRIGLSGGVSYNIPINRMFGSLLKKRGFTLMVHNQFPNGDGGKSIGQNAVSGRLIEKQKR